MAVRQGPNGEMIRYGGFGGTPPGVRTYGGQQTLSSGNPGRSGANLGMGAGGGQVYRAGAGVATPGGGLPGNLGRTTPQMGNPVGAWPGGGSNDWLRGVDFDMLGLNGQSPYGLRPTRTGMKYVIPPNIKNYSIHATTNQDRTGQWNNTGGQGAGRNGPQGGGGAGMGGGYPGYGGGGYGGIGGGTQGGFGGAGGLLAGSRLQELLDQANAANQQRLNSMLGLNEQEGAKLLEFLKGGYAGLEGKAGANKGEEMGFLGGEYGKIFDLLGKQSDAEYTREGQRRNRELGAASQSLVGRGLGNSTVVDSVRRGIVDDSALREQEIGDRRLQREAGYRSQFAGQGSDVLGRNNAAGLNIAGRGVDQQAGAMEDQRRERIGVLERVSELPPNLAAYMQLLQQPGATTGGRTLGGGSGGGGYGDMGAVDSIIQYLQMMMQGGGGGGRGGQNFDPNMFGTGDPFKDRNAEWIDQQTAINDRIRQEEEWKRIMGTINPTDLSGYLGGP